jgi:tetratricopeptide (TPR) repeat protein
MIGSIYRFIKECRSAFYHGIAFKKMELGKYEIAANLLEKLCQYFPEDKNIEYSYYSIGQCYFHMGKLETALSWLSKSYELYRINIQANQNFRYLSAYRDMLNLYCKALRINRQEGLADKLIFESDYSS